MTDDQLDLVFGALADRTRRAILAQLSREDTNVGGLTELFDMSQPAVSKHLKVLEVAGLISRTRQGTMRLSHLEAEPLKEATSWLSDYRAYWDESYRRLDDLLTQMDD
jgi:DNA-binding transcriptional ArsR family regulator